MPVVRGFMRPRRLSGLWQNVSKMEFATARPKDLSWNVNGVNWDGFAYPPDATEKSLKELMAYTPEKDDVLIATYPKSGTTWMLWICHQLANNGFNDFEKFHKLHPFIELDTTKWPVHVSMQDSPRPRIIKTHGPLRHMHKDVKTIFIVRDPRQVVVDFYQHSLFTNQLLFGSDFETFFDRFMKGQLFYGDWFEHTHEFVKAQDDPNVLFLYFEDMCKDLRPVLSQVNDFLGYDLPAAKLDELEPRFGFKYMQDEAARFDFTQEYPTRKDEGSFFGSVEKPPISADQTARLREKFYEFFPPGTLKYDI